MSCPWTLPAMPSLTPSRTAFFSGTHHVWTYTRPLTALAARSKLIHCFHPDAMPIDRVNTALDKDEKSRPFRIIENHNLTLEGATRLGCRLSNIGPEDLLAGQVRPPTTTTASHERPLPVALETLGAGHCPSNYQAWFVVASQRRPTSGIEANGRRLG